jgi:hypothetical protein
MPEAVKTAAAKADEMIRQLAAASNDAPMDEINIAPDTPTEPAPEAPPAPEPVTPPPPDDTARLRAENAHLRNEYGLEHQRYLSLQGMFQKANTQIEHLNAILADMQSAPAAAFLSDDDETQFGADLVDLSVRAARQVMTESKMAGGEEVAALKAEVERLKAAVGGVQSESAETRHAAFCNKVKSVVDQKTGGRFDEIDKSDAFAAWLSASPTRLNMFQSATQAADLEGVLTFFDMYGTQAQLISANQEQPKSPSPVDPRLERQVAPGKSRSTPSPGSTQDGAKRQWTRSGIAEFYKKKSTFPASTATALEQDIFAAQNEGRVDYSR